MWSSIWPPRALVRKSYEDAPLTFEANMLGTSTCWRPCAGGAPAWKPRSSSPPDKCYRNDEWVWGYRETDHLGGDDSYSASKWLLPRSSPIPISRAFSRTARPAPPCAPATSSAAVTGPPTASCRLRAPGPPVRPCRSAAPGPPPLAAGAGALSGYLWLGAHLLGMQGALRDPRRGPTTSALPPASTIPWRKWWRPGLHWPGFRQRWTRPDRRA